ncbi:MAG: helix-turn-helix transcriptional regulator [Acidobacteriia bacterium]|nr:helix-turn-helix transcriptional regulator [Terriglobia bacterium]
MPDEVTNFEQLQLQLIRHLQGLVRSGAITERSLARATGISQPHLHNVLKGKRLLSLEKADQVLYYLRIEVADLLASGSRENTGPE